MLKLIEISVRDIFKNLSLSISRGEFVLITGSNGVGKTTLFNAISGAISVKKGKIILNDNDITNLPQHKRSTMISSVLQDPRLGTVGEMTILENLNISYMRRKYKRISKNVVDYFREKLSILGMNLENRLNEYAKNLSGGQRQLLSLVMATISDYELLLLDEITASLDPKTSDTVMEMTNKIIAQEKKTCFLITHNTKYINNFGTRTLKMIDGKLA
ncbi:MAG: ATP-binding cassette domain-containing protein [Holosporales bacterium]|jgi:putative ABC transport system ATP-binding protein|nr:ATP-binding cassette domain-containing protein [Holosporales bacterium]